MTITPLDSRTEDTQTIGTVGSPRAFKVPIELIAKNNFMNMDSRNAGKSKNLSPFNHDLRQVHKPSLPANVYKGQAHSQNVLPKLVVTSKSHT